MPATSALTGIEDLIEALPESYSIAERELIQRAYRVAEEAHRGQKRVSGEPYVSHCVAVARILVDLSVPPEAVAAGLLHDTVEDTSLTLEDIRLDFGETIAMLVDGVTKLTKLPRVSRSDQHAGSGDGGPEDEEAAAERLRASKQDLATETLRKTFLAMGEDVRVVLIKLADRLHNMRTLGHMPEAKRKRISQQTMDVFAPLASRLGIWQMKWELEDLAFSYLNPQKYKEIAEQLAERRPDREASIATIIETIRKLLERHNIHAEVSGRPKHIYSIYKKMIRKDKPFELVRDIRAVRLIVPDIQACYATMGLIHTSWRPLSGEFDDYIAAPKDNYYQSLHTAVIFDDGKPVEVQIRTPEMDQNAELGIAAHWRYKEGKSRDLAFEQHVNWLRAMMDWKHDVDDAQEFVDGMRSDVFQDRVYVFTPKGDIIDLPAGSTPIDFAYHVHTDIGHRCRGARVNGKLVPLDQVLKTSDQVEVLTGKRGGPSRDWLNVNLGLVRTQRARSKIRAWFKKEDHEKNLSSGRELLERELQRLGMGDTNFERLARSLGYKQPDEMFVDLGCGDLSLARIVNLLSESQAGADLLTAAAPTSEAVATESINVVGLKGLLTTIAKCCHPTQGDQIIGFITRGRGVSIHRQDCPNILRVVDRDRLVRVSWGEHVRTYSVPIRITAYDRTGLMGDISNLLNSEDVNIVDVGVKVAHSMADLRLVVEVKDVKQLSRILTRIENIPNVLEAQRVKPG
ncbi:MAG: bifunctional (p)ppGpp synthetase/guanosine-3',5'-bis(diphosphate) 3'-pyrophosphohydrolase [Anaerolineales bacterium]|nr:bifunctional (p)ppGpp synthetase/guanosine-3',5'-bis(diphosphate) 3'-pyrophosphohydrolase [Anaerolineales bacterium]